MSVQAIGMAFETKDLLASEKLVLLCLANYAGPDLICWPSQETLANDTGLSERTIWACLKALEARSIISREKRYRSDGTRTSDVFTLCFGDASLPANSAKSTRNHCEDYSQPLPNPVATVAAQEPSLNRKEEPIVREPDLGEPKALPPEFELAWQACTPEMRSRALAKPKTYQRWRLIAKAVGHERLLAALKAYVAKDVDCKRTGGPGFHKWLVDGRYEQWLADLSPEPSQSEAASRQAHFAQTGEWRDAWGPKPEAKAA